ncbi:MAG: hypothetical protein PHN88_14815 [Ignavibacteria bacterium]|nr:hypothetical protein [Ignavibacteria bacterium]
MSKNVTVRGVKFKIVPTVPDADHEELGLYQNLDGTQEIRWSEAPIAGATETWKSGIVCQIGTLDRNLPTTGGGSQEEYSGLSIVVANGNKLILRLKELGIIINGKTAELWEFEGTDADADSVSSVTYFQGTASYELNSTWDERLWNIEITNNRYRRNAFFGTMISNDAVSGNYPDASDDMNGKIVPATFGKFQIEADGRINPAKFLRVANKKTLLTNSANKAAGNYCTPEDQSVFPVVGNFCGYTTTGSNNITVWGGASFFTVGDHIKVYTGFPDGTDKEILSIGATSITVNGSAATSDGITIMDFLHALNAVDTSCRVYTIKTGLDKEGTFSWPPSTLDNSQGVFDTLVGKWFGCVSGGSSDNTSLSGKYKKIEHFCISDWSYAAGVCLVMIQLNSIFEKNLSGNSTATATNQAWVSLSDIPFKHANDIWPCAGFLDAAGTISPNIKKLYVYKSDSSFLEKKAYKTDGDGNLIMASSASPVGFKEIAPFGYNASGANGNTVVIDAMHFENDPDNLVSFDIFPVASLSEYNGAATLALWGFSSHNRLHSDNIYYNCAEPTVHFHSTAGTEADVRDKNDTTYWQHSYVFDNEAGVTVPDYKLAFEAIIDVAKITHEYDGYYIGLNLESHIGEAGDGFSNSPVTMAFRRFMGSPVDILSSSLGSKYLDEGQEADEGGKIRCLPDWFYDVRTDDNDRAFLFTPTEAAQMRLLSGYSCFPLSNISTIDQLKSIYKLGLLFSIYGASGVSSITAIFKIFEMALICKTTGSISEYFFSLCAGRIFNDTWSTRKTAADMIVNPVDFIEHFLRLQWGGDLGDVVEYGKAYSANMPIKTGADPTYDNGSFDSTILTDVKTFSPSWQVLNKEEAYTDVQIGNLCRTFDLCVYTDISGNICITTLDKTNPSETIAFADIKGKIGWTKEPQIKNVYVQPIFNYGYNYGSEKFDRLMGVQNVQAAVYSAEYTPGIDNTKYTLQAIYEPEISPPTTPDGEYVWNACRALYLKYGQIERCPSSFSDQKLLTKYEDTLKIFYKKIIGQTRLRQSLNVSYEKGRYYHPGKHAKIKLPHQTLNLSVEVVIERIKIGRYDDNIQLDVVLLEDIPTAFFFE